MKKSAIVLLCIPLILVGVIYLQPEKADHGSSPAFNLALRDAVDKLEGVALKTTAAVSTPANASRLDLRRPDSRFQAMLHASGWGDDLRRHFADM